MIADKTDHSSGYSRVVKLVFRIYRGVIPQEFIVLRNKRRAQYSVVISHRKRSTGESFDLDAYRIVDTTYFRFNFGNIYRRVQRYRAI